MSNELYTEEHNIFRDMFRKFVAKEITPNVEQWEAEGSPKGIMAQNG